ncbi:AP-2 complex subunit sigma-like protein [Drosera capensis]
MSDPLRRPDPFLDAYTPLELRIASEFLTTWLPFLTRGLCDRCSDSLSRRVKSIPTGESESKCETKCEAKCEAESVSLTTNVDGCDTHSVGSWKDETETNSVGSWKDEANGWSDTSYVERGEASSSKVKGNGVSASGRMSWADMAQEDELEAEEEREGTSTSDNGTASDMGVVSKERKLSRDEREYYRFVRVKRKKDFIWLERIDRKLVNILDGLELHSGVFSAVEQKRIVDFIYELQESGQKGELRERTYTAPRKSALVLNGNGADVAKHCVPAVPTKRISITFRRMDVSKRPFHYSVERDLQGLQPLKYGVDVPEKSKSPQKTSQMRTRRVHTSGMIMIRFILLQNRQGKTRLAKYYVPLEDSEKHKVEYEVHRLVVNRDPKFTNFVEFRTHKVIYRRYAGLFFSMCVDITDNELAYLECIHLFVEILDHFFSNVCELDLVFNFHKVFLILDEFILAGELMETSKKAIIERMGELEKLE